jgi:hypothetical protein
MVRRPRVRLPTLASKGSGGKKAKQHLDGWKAVPTAPSDFPGHWNKPDVRGALYAMRAAGSTAIRS